jgi:hypothetical protein
VSADVIDAFTERAAACIASMRGGAIADMEDSFRRFTDASDELQRAAARVGAELRSAIRELEPPLQRQAAA